MGLLIKYYKKYKEEGIKEPNNIENNIISKLNNDNPDFVWFQQNYNTTNDNNDYILLNDLYELYRIQRDHHINIQYFNEKIRRVLKHVLSEQLYINGKYETIYRGFTKNEDNLEINENKITKELNKEEEYYKNWFLENYEITDKEEDFTSSMSIFENYVESHIDVDISYKKFLLTIKKITNKNTYEKTINKKKKTGYIGIKHINFDF